MSERDVVLRERAAADKAIEWVFAQARRHYGINGGIEGVDARRYAEENYPLPTYARRRIVLDPQDTSVRWTVGSSGALCYDRVESVWAQYPAKVGGWNVPEPTLERCKLWTDLLENPNETVSE